jgi:hypothetical protein
MSNRTVMTNVFCPLILLLLALPLHAGDSDAASTEAPTQHSSNVAPQASEAEIEAAANEASRNCLRATGSRIVRTSTERCNRLPGSTYSREDLERTGQTDVGHALERLDPRIRVR